MKRGSLSRFLVGFALAAMALAGAAPADAVPLAEPSFHPMSPGVGESLEARLAVGGTAEEATRVYTDGTYAVSRDRVSVYACEAPVDAPAKYLYAVTVYDLAAGDYVVHFYVVPCVSDGVVVTQVGDPVLVAVSVVTVGALVQEFYHPDLNHYFMTADPLEARWLAENVATLGWRPTGFVFRAYTNEVQPVGTLGVCRFYGSVSPGPNSHFYTLDPDECEFLEHLQAITPPELPRWNFEAIAFRAFPPISGACFFDQIAVYRAYNDRALFNDSNHRYFTDLGLALEFVARNGWIFEGVVMCARP